MCLSSLSFIQAEINEFWASCSGAEGHELFQGGRSQGALDVVHQAIMSITELHEFPLCKLGSRIN